VQLGTKALEVGRSKSHCNKLLKGFEADICRGSVWLNWPDGECRFTPSSIQRHYHVSRSLQFFIVIVIKYCLMFHGQALSVSEVSGCPGVDSNILNPLTLFPTDR